MIQIRTIFFSICAVATSVCAELSYNFDVKPILSSNCIGCHGPDPEHRGGDWRMDTREGALRNKGIIPGDAEKSEVYKRIISTDKKYRMPEASHGDPLPQEKIDIIKQWIDEGAKYETHWSFVKPEKTEPPKPEAVDRVRNPIDSFVFKKLEEEGLSPVPEADPHEQIRRVALDLTGLPPGLEVVEAFAADPSDAHYERIVDNLLASPAYGEKWAAQWMDIGRYADTIGYAEDKYRDIWPWRDWVIRALNENMSYEDFSIRLLAGDLLEKPTDDDILATAFHRNTPTNSEGGTSDEEFRTVAVKDRIGVTFNAWMGLTMRCAECHTHKYDPITQKEYYEFLDFFNQTADYDHSDDRPRKNFFPEGREAEFAKLDQQIEKLKKERADSPSPWKQITPWEVSAKNGTLLHLQSDNSILASGPNPKTEDYSVGFVLEPGTYTGLRLEIFPDKSSNDRVGRNAEGAMILSRFQLKRAGSDERIKFTKALADYHQPNFSAQLTLQDKIDSKKGWGVSHGELGFSVRRYVVYQLDKPLVLEKPESFSVELAQQSPWSGVNISRFRLSATDKPDPVDLFKKKKLDPLDRELGALTAKRFGAIRVPVISERPENQRRKTHINLRGAYQALGDQVHAAVPASFHPFPEDAPKNRLGVAQWLMHPDNPLTARVAVNRYWAQFFGLGIVETEEDFGSQGTLPSHPELLDWLAADFRDNGWDVKELLKLIVTSSAYRQSGKATPEILKIDSRNRLISRGPRFRLTAETVRDQALAVSGLLSRKLYGPPVFPPNPIKKYVNAFTGGMTWTVSEGEDRYRRALYTYLKRSQPHPLFETFDMATREVCNLRRFRTNTPLQSFQTLNDVAFVEAAQALSRQMFQQGETVEQQVAYGLKKALLAPPQPEHVETLADLYRDTLADYQSRADEAKKLAGSFPKGEHSDAELAAMTVTANVILNLDAFLTK